MSCSVDDEKVDEPNSITESITIESCLNDNLPSSNSSIHQDISPTINTNDVHASSSSIVVDILDLSGKSLSSIPSPSADNRDQYKHVKKLIIANNAFNAVHGLTSFSSVVEIDASNNKLHRFACFESVKHHLEILDVSHNDIHICDQLNHLVALRKLNISHNKIEQLPCNIEQLRYLTRIDVSYNQLTQLPKLIHLVALKYVSFNGNHINSLQNAIKLLPISLESIDLSANTINDLTELLNLSTFRLNSLNIVDNPCVDCVGREFDYRPFLVSCCPDTLRIIDGFVVTETEEIKGEWLYSHGKTRQFKSTINANKALCEYLTKYCPLNISIDRPLNDEFDVKLKKVIEKRREYHRLSGSSDVGDISSSTSDTHKDNRFTPMSPRNTISSLSFDSSSTLTVLSPKQNANKSLPHLRTTFDFGATQHRIAPTNIHSSSITFRSPSQNRQTSPRSPSNRRTVAARFAIDPNKMQCSIDKHQINNSIMNIQSSTISAFAIDLPMDDDDDTSRPKTPPPLSAVSAARTVDQRNRQVHAAVRLQATWRGVLSRRRHLPELTAHRTRLLYRQVQTLQRELTEIRLRETKLQTLNAHLTDLVEQLGTRLQSLNTTVDRRIASIESTLIACLPTPVELDYERRGDDRAVLRWNLATPIAQIKGYSLFIDGDHCGDVTALNRTALVTDLDFSKEHLISLQAISSSTGLRSQMSSQLKINCDKLTQETVYNGDCNR